MGQYQPEGIDMSLAIQVIAYAVGAVVVLLLLIAFIRRFYYVAQPHEALIFSGRSHTLPDGTVVGYRILTEGRSAIRIPILERIDYMDMRLLAIDVVVQNAYSAGNIPLRIHAIANVKIHSDARFIGNAVERFLGRGLDAVRTVAQQTLEGALREVLAQLTPEEVNEDRLKFAETLIHAAERDLQKLGLELDTLKIQHVEDEVGYLESLGRPRIAAALRDAENAENQANQETTQAQARGTQRAEIAKATAETAVLQKKNDVRRVRAELDGQAKAVELEAEAAAKTVRAEAERDLQAVRADLEQRRLQADVVIPAEIQRAARAIIAKGDAAPTIENGAAQVEVLRQMTEAWDSMGSHAKEIYVIQHLDQIVGTVAARVKGFDVGEVHVLDQGDGQAIGTYAASYAQMVAAVMRALADSTGVDVPAILNRETSAPKPAGGTLPPPSSIGPGGAR